MLTASRLFAALITSASLAPGLALAEKLVIPDPNYASGRATAFAVKGIIEEALGLEVETVPVASVPVVWEAMSRGTGEVDIWTETWLPNQSAPKTKYADEEKLVTVGEKSFPAVQGYCVPKAAAEKHNIRSVFDLANPEIAALFDSDGNGKGEVWIGPQGWLSTNIETIRARDYGFAEFFELQSTDEAIATAGLDAAVKADRPWLGYCYGPHQNFAIYDLVLLQEPAHDPANFVIVQPDQDPDWQAKSHVASAYPETTVHISWSANLATRDPALVTLLQNIQLSADDVNKWSLEIINGKDPNEVVKPWIEANSAQIAAWTAQ